MEIWNDCQSNIYDIINQKLQQNISNLENNEYGYYGIIAKNNDFLIRDVSSEKSRDAKAKSSRTKGKNCKSWKRKDLLFLIFKFNIINTNPIFNGKSNYTTENQIKLIKNAHKFKHARMMIEKYNINLYELTKKQIDIIFYFGFNDKKKLCNYIKNFFINKNLIFFE